MKKIALLIFILTNLIVAQESEQESWYINVNLGYSSLTYPKVFQDDIDNVSSNNNIEHTPVFIDLGFYLAIGSNKALGLVFTGSGDRFTNPSNNRYYQMNTYLNGLSFLNYFNETFGKDFYGRLDLGFSSAIEDANGQLSKTVDNGLGYLLGIGYTIPLANGETRINFGANYCVKSIEKENVIALNIFGGFLF